MGPIGIFGGTFDPIHYGHLRTALEVLQRLSLTKVCFVPCADPPHRDAATVAGASTRLDMVRAAVADQSSFVVDDREFKREGPSYSVDTLGSLRSEYPAASLCLLMGMDSFLGLPDWYHWEEITALAHIVVAHRPGWRVPEDGALGELLRERGTDDVASLHDSMCGRVFVTPVTQLEISATQLRASLNAGVDPKFLMPNSVRRIIIESGCYVEDN
ncbi:MAG: nicotinate-nucleotide adenylyltransferase [Gammaproteobacteria bacterium]